MKRQKLLIIILSVLLLLAAFYIAVTKVTEQNTAKMQSAYDQGMQTGYESAVKQLLQQLSTCNPVPVFADNVTLNAIAIECLEQQQPNLE